MLKDHLADIFLVLFTLFLGVKVILIVWIFAEIIQFKVLNNMGYVTKHLSSLGTKIKGLTRVFYVNPRLLRLLFLLLFGCLTGVFHVPSILLEVLPDDDSIIDDSGTFWERHKTKILVGVGIMAIGIFAYLVFKNYSNGPAVQKDTATKDLNVTITPKKDEIPRSENAIPVANPAPESSTKIQLRPYVFTTSNENHPVVKFLSLVTREPLISTVVHPGYESFYNIISAATASGVDYSSYQQMGSCTANLVHVAPHIGLSEETTLNLVNNLLTTYILYINTQVEGETLDQYLHDPRIKALPFEETFAERREKAIAMIQKYS